MKQFKTLVALVLALSLTLSLTSAFAATITINSKADSNEAAAETTAYKAWKLLDADIEDASKITVDEDTGESTATTTGTDVPKVAYYTTSSAAKTALEDAGLFTFTQVGTEEKWYATAKENLTAAEVTGAFDDWTDAQMTTAFGSPAEGAQTTPGGSATITASDPGYYYIKSTLGDEIAVQTLADVTINTKNDYVTHDKQLKETTDADVQLGDEVTYTLTVNIPESANDEIVLTDVMDDGLTFKSIDATFSDSVAYTFAPTEKTAAAVTNNNNTFTLTIAADVVKANKNKTLTIDYTAVVNNKAVVAVPEKNTVTLDYGNHYTSKPKEVEVVTHKFTFDKVDGSTKLTGAEFELQLSGTALSLVVITEGEEYRIATSEDATTTNTIVTAGKTITIDGVDSDVTYQLVETKAPAGGYNLKTDPTDVTPNADDDTVVHIDVENNKGSVLPSTGGIGTTIFYVAGIVLVLGAAAVLVARRKAEQK